jgi:uncharacterized protein with PIN domain
LNGSPLGRPLKFWDSSAIVPLLVSEPSTPLVQQLFAADPALNVWWATETECVCAVSRLERSGDPSNRTATQAITRFDAPRAAWIEIQAVEGVRRTARRLLRVHDLRAGVALQVAAALIASEDHPESLEVVALDARLVVAAEREGLTIIEPEPGPSR